MGDAKALLTASEAKASLVPPKSGTRAEPLHASTVHGFVSASSMRVSNFTPPTDINTSPTDNSTSTTGMSIRHLQGFYPPQTTLIYQGFEYRTMMSGISPSVFASTCHGMAYESMPPGYSLAPNTASVINGVVAANYWSTDVLVLYSGNNGGLDNNYPAYETRSGTRSGAGSRFGDGQAKARTRVSGGVTQWMCPWTCYQILVRRPVVGTSSSDAFTVTSGSCVASGSCVRDGGGTSDYSNNERCTIRANYAMTISSSYFSTESCCDRLTIRGTQYQGSSGPSSVSLSASQTFSWYTDGSVTCKQWLKLWTTLLPCR